MTSQDIENNSLVYDWETPLGCALVCFYSFQTEEYTDFIINKYRNDLPQLIKFLEKNQSKYFIGFNNISFDNQILEYIYKCHEEWYDLTGHQIAEKIHLFGDRTIDDSNYGLFPRWREEDMQFTPIDVPRILHWFNENKRVSLKQAEFELRAETIENFEIDPKKEDFTLEEVEDLIFYCHNDVRYTAEIFKYVTGKVTHPLYKGKDKLFDRIVVQKEVGLSCLNWDDVKIGAEWNKLDYCKATGRDEKELRPKKINHFYGKKYRQFFPNTVSFQSKEVQDFVRSIGNTIIKDIVVNGKKKKQEFKHKFNEELTVTIARGGIHSNEKPRFLQPKDNEIFLQNDIGSQYPNGLRKYGIYPLHLGKEWNDAIPIKIERRLTNKSLYKKTKEPKYNSLQEMGKLQLNGGLYGRLNTTGDWQQDPCAMLKVTIGCQLEILMIVEALLLKGFRITSCNTDGWDCIIPRERLEEYFDIVAYYEEKIGNKELGNVEFTVFGWMAQTSVNDYAAEKIGVYEKRQFLEDRIAQKGATYPHLKLKGDFTVDYELHKNSSFRVIPMAIVEYFDRGTDVETFINNHQDIFDFCARSNSGATYYHEGYAGRKNGKPVLYAQELTQLGWIETSKDSWVKLDSIEEEEVDYRKTGVSLKQALKIATAEKEVYEQVMKLPKLIRYYVAKDGIQIRKIVKPEVTTKARNANVQPAEYLKKVCNRLPKVDHSMHLRNVDRSWYIQKALELIFNVEHGKKARKQKPVPKEQISLF